MTREEIAEVLRLHALYVYAAGDPAGKRADLRGANLYGADLRGANLYGADLRRANLHGADLRRANLHGANLRGADLYGADLRDANLRDANLRGAKIDPVAAARLSIVPSHGSFVGWKKGGDGRIIQLRIPEDAERSNATGRKCRASAAVVLAIYGVNNVPCKSSVSWHDDGFVYRVGETVTPEQPFDENRWEECASGIHFFLTREEAEAYDWS